MSSPEMPSDTQSAGRRKRPTRRTVGAAVVLVAGGAVTGGILAGTLGASAATSPSPSPSTPSTTAPNTNPANPRGHLPLTGTVTAVGTDTVTIKTSTGTATYSVTTDSDIDKNGEAKLSDLKVGDAVRFDTTTRGGAVIGHLHAGDEALNRPGRGPGGPGAPGTPGGSTAPSTGAAFTGTNA